MAASTVQVWVRGRLQRRWYLALIGQVRERGATAHQTGPGLNPFATTLYLCLVHISDSKSK